MMVNGGGDPEMIPLAPDPLQDYRLRFLALAEHTSLGQFQLSLAGGDYRVISVNRVLDSLLGYGSPADLSGVPARDLVALPGDLTLIEEEIRNTGAVAGREIRLRQKDGSEIWVSLQAWLLGSPKTAVVEGFCFDITEHRIFEQEMQYHDSELNRYALALATANRKLNLLSSITRHDILNKLTGLSGYVELMKDEFPEPRAREFLDIEEKIIREITGHVQFTKDYQEIGIQTPRWFDLGEIVRPALSSLSVIGKQYSVETANLSVYADPMLAKVFTNLADNSVRHAKDFTRVSVRAEIAGNEARIIYEDDGCGVPGEFKEAIFCRQHFTHTGFGLYLSREILGITGLTIRETGTPGNGARFEITVPAGYFRAGTP